MFASCLRLLKRAQDLKADNILVENTGICKISDFGISKRTDVEQQAAYTAMQGTVFWMAPEVVKASKAGYTSKIDIWSVGCVVLEMWCGHRPWQDMESFAVMFQVNCYPCEKCTISKLVPQLFQAEACPPVPDHVQLSPDAEDFRLKCFAMYVPRTLCLIQYTNGGLSNPEQRATAAGLRSHPYLQLPMFWSFNGDFKS